MLREPGHRWTRFNRRTRTRCSGTARGPGSPRPCAGSSSVRTPARRELLATVREVLRRRGRLVRASAGGRTAAGRRARCAPRRPRCSASSRVGELLRLLVDERVVHQVQRLQRRRAGDAAVGAGVGVGAVEERQERVPLDALRHQVDAAAVGVVDGLERVVLREVPGRLARERVRRRRASGRGCRRPPAACRGSPRRRAGGASNRQR